MVIFSFDPYCGKVLICIENANFKKPKTSVRPYDTWGEMDVFGNAKFSLIGEIKTFPRIEYFFLRSLSEGLSSGMTYLSHTESII